MLIPVVYHREVARLKTPALRKGFSSCLGEKVEVGEKKKKNEGKTPSKSVDLGFKEVLRLRDPPSPCRVRNPARVNEGRGEGEKVKYTETLKKVQRQFTGGGTRYRQRSRRPKR